MAPNSVPRTSIPVARSRRTESTPSSRVTTGAMWSSMARATRSASSAAIPSAIRTRRAIRPPSNSKQTRFRAIRVSPTSWMSDAVQRIVASNGRPSSVARVTPQQYERTECARRYRGSRRCAHAQVARETGSAGTGIPPMERGRPERYAHRRILPSGRPLPSVAMTDRPAGTQDPTAPIDIDAYLARFAWHPEPELIGFRDEGASRAAMRRLAADTWDEALDFLYEHAPERAMGDASSYDELRRRYFGAGRPARPGPGRAGVRRRGPRRVPVAAGRRTARVAAPAPVRLLHATPAADVDDGRAPRPDGQPGRRHLARRTGRRVRRGGGRPLAVRSIGYGAGSFGLLTSGGVMANFMGMALARDLQLGRRLGLGRPPRGASSTAPGCTRATRPTSRSPAPSTSSGSPARRSSSCPPTTTSAFERRPWQKPSSATWPPA